MLKRSVFVGLALAGLAVPAVAAPVFIGSDDETWTATDDMVVARPRGLSGRRARTARVTVLPPLRPAFDMDAAATPPAGEAATTVPEPSTFAAAAEPSSTVEGHEADATVRPVAVLPPLRPAFGGAQASDAPAADLAEEVDGSGPTRPVVVRLLPPPRPAFRADRALAATDAMPAPAPEPEQPRSLFGSLFNAPVAAAAAIAPAVAGVRESVVGVGRSALSGLIALHAKANDVPEDLVHRVVIRESKYDPKAIGSGGAMGLMQIKYSTARALGYAGPASGLLDANTNLTYAVKYLAGAYRTADGNYDQAVRYYARGYYYAQKAKTARYASGRSRSRQVREADASAATTAAEAKAR